ncbi:tyrosine-protein kinase receptor Tie-1-like [Asterias amurensis]|uniref:tyrosine-protein kinase receptor Tie-1-like n=1 Tax=Asterias amurensis TaxID=7602 RepID=UPI003AB60635
MTQPIISGGMSNPAQPPINIHMTEEEVKYEYVGLPTWAVKWSILWTNVILEETVLGRGYFGEVRLGGIKMGGNRVTKAAIKMLIAGASEKSTADFWKEFKTMTVIGPHPNVISLLGACINAGNLYVALEYLPGNNLHKHLLENGPNQQQRKPLTIMQKLKFSVDIAKGMQHLSAAGIIHRNLAARNILLGEELVAKVSDFGLSRREHIYVQVSETAIPIRWLSIESLTSQLYVSESDVWSFGILLWEIMTFGGVPYQSIHTTGELINKLLGGYRMPQPEACPDKIYDLMLKCWNRAPNLRPSFKVITEELDKIRVALEPHIYETSVLS